MMLAFVVRVFSALLCFVTTASYAVPFTKPGCQEKCGNVTIPYPFGIGSKCSANSSFTIICQNSTTIPPRPLLASMEVVNISRYGIVIVNLPVSPKNCSGGTRTESVPISLKGGPFFISARYNSLVVMSCRNLVWLHFNATTVAGCMAVCDANSTDTTCNGVNCCQTYIPARRQELQYTYQSVRANNSSLCGYVFPADKNWLHYKGLKRYEGLMSDLSNPFDREFEYAPLVLEWGSGIEKNFSSKYSNYHHNGSRTIIVTASIVIGSVVGVHILFVAAWKFGRAIKETIKAIKASRKYMFFKRNGGILLEQQLATIKNGIEKTKLFSSEELTKATDEYNENRILGRGGEGVVYKGMLEDGRIVAIKKSERVNQGDVEAFINEVVIVSQIDHRNVVKLLGCCLESETPHLVYEFIPNGTLFSHIHHPHEDFPLLWEMRVRIAKQVAGALAYLHSSASVPIYHRDIKSTNILLDEKYHAKISDFGTSRSISIDQTHVTTRVVGTFGYLDPEYFQSNKFTEKSDVYSFGVVLVELLTGEKAISAVRVEEGRGLAMHFLQSMEEDRLFNIIDARVLIEGKREEIEAMAEIARKCLHLNGKGRPTMKEVARHLEGIQAEEENNGCNSVEDFESDGLSSISEITESPSLDETNVVFIS